MRNRDPFPNQVPPRCMEQKQSDAVVSGVDGACPVLSFMRGNGGFVIDQIKGYYTRVAAPQSGKQPPLGQSIFGDELKSFLKSKHPKFEVNLKELLEVGGLVSQRLEELFGHSHTHTLTHSHTHTLTHSHTHTLTHSHTRTLTHSHTHTLTHSHYRHGLHNREEKERVPGLLPKQCIVHYKGVRDWHLLGRTT
jgi:hypothetical protein